MTADGMAGLRFPLDCAGLGTFGIAQGTEKLEQGLKLILQTYPGERVMRPDFGCRLRDYLFEVPTPDIIARLTDEVDGAIRTWEPRVVVEEVQVRPDEAVDGLLHLVISYRARGDSEHRDLVVAFHTDRHQPDADDVLRSTSGGED
jgi:phage baseplate assembly protein W